MSLTIGEMHIGIDLGLQQLDSNVFSKIKREHKDYAINAVIIQRYTDLLIAAQNVVSNELTYAEILKFYGKLAPILHTKSLNVHTGDNRYVYADMPDDSGNTISSGRLIAGIEYKVVASGGGSEDFGNVGHVPTLVYKGDTLTCVMVTLTNLAGVLPVTLGDEYRIAVNDGEDLSSFGASNNAVGTTFVATASGNISMGTTVQLDVLKTTPTAWGNAQLTPLYNLGVMGYLSSRSLLDVGNEITSGKIYKGKRYKVLITGTVDLSTFGGMLNPLAGYIFNCTLEGTPAWDGTMVVTQVDYRPNDLVKINDEENFMRHAFGTSINNPMTSIEGNKLKIYTDGEFVINNVEVIYGRYPIKVDYNNTISSELGDNELTKIVDETVSRIMNRTGNPAAQVIQGEISQKQ